MSEAFSPEVFISELQEFLQGHRMPTEIEHHTITPTEYAEWNAIIYGEEASEEETNAFAELIEMGVLNDIFSFHLWGYREQIKFGVSVSLKSTKNRECIEFVEVDVQGHPLKAPTTEDQEFPFYRHINPPTYCIDCRKDNPTEWHNWLKGYIVGLFAGH